MSQFFQFPWSPYCIKAWLVLNELSIPHEECIVDPRDAATVERLEAAAAVRSFPVYVDDDGTVIRDSSSIIEHLCAHHPDGDRFVPNDPAAAREARRWERFVNDQLMGPCTYLGFGLRMSPERQNAKKLAAERAKLERALGVLNEHLSAESYLAAGRYTQAELALLSTIEALRWDGTVTDFSPWPAVVAWWDRAREPLDWGALEASLARVRRAYD